MGGKCSSDNVPLNFSIENGVYILFFSYYRMLYLKPCWISIYQ